MERGKGKMEREGKRGRREREERRERKNYNMKRRMKRSTYLNISGTVLILSSDL